MFSLRYRDILPGSTLDELEQLVAKMKAFLLAEHNDDGSHPVDEWVDYQPEARRQFNDNATRRAVAALIAAKSPSRLHDSRLNSPCGSLKSNSLRRVVPISASFSTWTKVRDLPIRSRWRT